MSLNLTLKKGVPHRLPVTARYLNIHESTGEFLLEAGGAGAVAVDGFDFMDFGEGSEAGQQIILRNESASDIDVTLSFSAFLLTRRRKVEVGGTVPVGFDGAQPVEFESAQPVSVDNSSPIEFFEAKADRVFSVGAVTIAADGLPVALDFSGAYGFGFGPSVGASWAGIDLSQGFSMGETEHKKTGAAGSVSGAVGQVVNFWKVS